MRDKSFFKNSRTAAKGRAQTRAKYIETGHDPPGGPAAALFCHRWQCQPENAPALLKMGRAWEFPTRHILYLKGGGVRVSPYPREQRPSLLSNGFPVSAKAIRRTRPLPCNFCAVNKPESVPRVRGQLIGHAKHWEMASAPNKKQGRPIALSFPPALWGGGRSRVPRRAKKIASYVIVRP